MKMMVNRMDYYFKNDYIYVPRIYTLENMISEYINAAKQQVKIYEDC